MELIIPNKMQSHLIQHYVRIKCYVIIKKKMVCTPVTNVTALERMRVL